MDCEHLPKYVDFFLDGELADVEHAAIEAHLQQCESCCEVISRESRFRVALHQSLRTVVTPNSLRNQIEAKIDSAGKSRYLPTLAYAAGIALIAGLGYAVVANIIANPGFEEQAIAFHQQNEKTEIVGNRSEVDSFLKIRAPFSYQVPLEDTGDIKLVGARLATVGGNPAVVFLYDGGGRRFSVTQYKPPSDWQPGPARIGRQEGYTYATYGDGALVQTLVGDMPEAELTKIVPAAWQK